MPATSRTPGTGTRDIQASDGGRRELRRDRRGEADRFVVLLAGRHHGVGELVEQTVEQVADKRRYVYLGITTAAAFTTWLRT
ncbi:hypothetical protein ACWKT5_21770 [Streptomyces avermitilis]